MKIRAMEQKDFPDGIELVAQFNDSSLSEYGNYMELDRMKEVFEAVYATSFVVEKEGKVVGLLAGHIVKDFCSGFPVYEEVLWYMDEKHRRYGLKLFRHVQQWCEVHNIKRMTMCCMWNSKKESLFTLYEKLGFRPMETRFIKELK